MPPLLRPITATRTRLGAWPWRAMAATALALLLWDASDLDLLIMQHVGSPNGFPLRMNFWLENLLHIGGRNLAIALYLTLWVLALAWPARSHPVIGTRKQRSVWLLGVLMCLTLVSGLKAVSTTSCPWDLQAFGGPATYVSHWAFGMTDGGGGHCFPGGHASSAFAFLALTPVWLAAADPAHRRLGRQLVWAIVITGILFGAAQTLRGAHEPSHTAWTAWLCWVGAWAWFTVYQAINRCRGR